jgi:hypothetical protein
VLQTLYGNSNSFNKHANYVFGHVLVRFGSLSKDFSFNFFRMKLDFSEFLWDPFYKVRNDIPELFASAMMSMIVMKLRTEMTLEDLDYAMMLILALLTLVTLMLINGTDDDIDSNDSSLHITLMMIFVVLSLCFRCLNIKTTKIKTMLQVDLRGVTEIIFSEIHSVNLFLTKVLNWGSLTLTFRNINRYSLAFYQDPAIGAASS